jgi:hypothetical protein
MFNKIFIFFIATLFTAPFITAQEGKANAFVGVDVCAPCHRTEKQGRQVDIWKETKHSKAFLTLQTKEANDIAAKLGHPTPAAETEACLKCHASGFNFDKSLIGAKFSVAEGVQCETCHGPGSNYRPAKIMRDREEAIKHGLIVYEKIEDLCVKCHNPDSPTFREIDFAEAWEEIKHPVPASK